MEPEETDAHEMVVVASFLTSEEASLVRRLLARRRIHSITKESGPHDRYVSCYYQVSVKASDYSEAKGIVDYERALIFANGKKCPKCKHPGFKKIAKNGLWERIFYAGTTRVQCDKCDTKYFI